MRSKEKRVALLPSLPPAAPRASSSDAEHQTAKEARRTAADERLQNLRFRSTAKTLARRLNAAVEEGDESRVAEEHKKLIAWLDRAAARGALHKNTAARRKSQADRLASRSRS